MLKPTLPLVLLLALATPYPAQALPTCQDAAFAATAHPDHPRARRTRNRFKAELLKVIASLNTGKLGSDEAIAYMEYRFLAIGIRGKGQFSAKERANQFAREAAEKIPALREGSCLNWRG